MLPVDQTLQLLHQYLTAELGETNIRLEQRSNETRILVQKVAGAKSVMGTFMVKRDESLSPEAQSLVIMKRSKVQCLPVLTNSWLTCRDRSCTGEPSGGPSSEINGWNSTLSRESEPVPASGFPCHGAMWSVMFRSTSSPLITLVVHISPLKPGSGGPRAAKQGGSRT
jgi:hypothetical protein